MFEPEESVKSRCAGCEYKKRVYSQDNYSFYGCYHRPYTGKRVLEIKDCPKLQDFSYGEVRKYRDMEQRLKKVYGDCDGLLEKVVEHLVTHEDITLPEPIFKARMLTDDEVDRWEAYKAIGTVEECREAMEKRMEVTPTITANFYACPDCGAIRSMRQKHNYCHDCGQAFNWS